MFKIKNIIKWSKNRMDTAKEWISWKIRLTLLERRKKKKSRKYECRFKRDEGQDVPTFK